KFNKVPDNYQAELTVTSDRQSDRQGVLLVSFWIDSTKKPPSSKVPNKYADDPVELLPLFDASMKSAPAQQTICQLLSERDRLIQIRQQKQQEQERAFESNYHMVGKAIADTIAKHCFFAIDKRLKNPSTPLPSNKDPLVLTKIF